jgi:AraC-like DNA-binding protein
MPKGGLKGSVQSMQNAIKKEFQNEIKFSSILEIDAPLDTSRFHIALPTRGIEPYLVDGHYHQAGTDQFFIFNPKQHVKSEGRFKEPVEGLCLFISNNLIAETAQMMGLGDSNILDQAFPYNWQQNEFLVKSYQLEENSFGRFLKAIKPKLLGHITKQDYILDNEAFFSDLAERFLRSQLETGQALKSIPAFKTSTKAELFKRLTLIHAYIRENYLTNLDLDQLSTEALLSKYHLIRLYKSVYGNTPYQEILQLRLEHSKLLLKEGKSYQEIADHLHFTDGKAFAKSFKKRFGMNAREW